MALHTINSHPNTVASTTETGMLGTLALEKTSRYNGHYVVYLGLHDNNNLLYWVQEFWPHEFSLVTWYRLLSPLWLAN